MRRFTLFGLVGTVSALSVVASAQDAGFAAIEQKVDRVADIQVYYQYLSSADPDIAVSPTRIVLVTNGGVEIWDRAFTPLFRTDNNLRKGSNDQNITTVPLDPPEPVAGFIEATVAADTTSGFSGAGTTVPDPLTGSRIFDPKAYWDADSERFFVVGCERASFQDLLEPTKIIGQLRIAVSKTSTPNTFDAADWYFFNFDVLNDISSTAVGFPDLSRTWISEEHLYIMFRDADLLAPGTQRDTVPSVGVAIAKASLITGTTPSLPLPSVTILNRDGIDCDNNPMTALPDCVETVAETNLHGMARTYGLTNTSHAYSIAANQFPQRDGVRDNLVLGALTLSGGTLSYESVLVPIPSGHEFTRLDITSFVPTPESGEAFAATSPLFHQPAFRNGSLWAALHGRPVVDDGTGTLIPDPNDNRLLIYWYEIDPDGFPAVGANPSVLQSGVIDPAVYQQDLVGAHAVDPSVAVNSQNTVTMTFHVSSSTKHPSIFRVTRYQTQPAGTFPIFNEVVTGTTILHRPPGAALNRKMAADFTGTVPDPTDVCLFWGHGMVGGPPDMLLPLDPEGDRTDRYQTYLTRYQVCNSQNSFADVDGNGEVSMNDYDEFLALFRAGDRRGDANADGFHDMLDVLMISDEMAARGVVR